MLFFELLNLRRGFSQYFQFVPALTLELAKEVFRIRHKVYCEDLKFEATRSDGMETDEFDDHAIYSLVRSAITGEYVGCARLILPCPQDPTKRFPVERSCSGTIDPKLFDPATFERSKLAEVSRLAVLASYRRRKGEANDPAPINDDSFGTRTQPRFPYIPLALYFGCAALARRNGIEEVLVLTEPRLANHFRKLGMGIRTIGSGVDHRGYRVPSVINAQTFPRDINFALRSLYQLIEDEVERGYAALGTARLPQAAAMSVS